jgi:signal transduction histidine kinase
MAQIDTAVRAFYRVTLSLAGLFALALLALQTVQARRLAGRLLALSQHMQALRAGNLDQAPPADRSGDEIAHLRDVIAEATGKLAAAREAQERLIADAAHELRTPLTLMRTSIDLALRKQRDARELREALAETRKEVDRLAALAGNLLDLAAIGRGAWDRQAGDLLDVAREAVEGARAEAEERGLLIQLCADAPAPALFHAGAMRQALDNLLSNAIKFSPPGGIIEMALQTSGSRHLIIVQDQGPGIAEAEREAVFAPFRRALRGTPGAGLGLTIVREIAQRHGGRVWVAESAHRGARLVLEI